MPDLTAHPVGPPGQFAILIVSLLGYAAFVARRWRSTFGIGLFVGVSSILVVLYAAALAGVLRPASFLVLALGLVLFAAATGTVEGRSTLRRLSGPAMVGYGIAALALWFRLHREEYGQWDEFSHWGLFTKILAMTHTLPGAESAVILKTYPPGAAIWQYFVTRAVGYAEGHVYFAQALLLATPLLVLTDDRWKNWASTVAMIALSYLALFLFGNELQSLLVDQLVGVFFGGVLATYALSSRDAAAVVRAAPPLFCLVILKEAGILLAAIAVAVIVLDQAMRRIRPPALDSLDAADTRGTSARSIQAALAVLVVAPVLAAASWHVHVRMNDLGRPMAAGMTMEQVRRSFSAAATPRDITTISRFRDALGEAAVGNAYTGGLLNALMTRLGVVSEVKAVTVDIKHEEWKPESGTIVASDNEGVRFQARDLEGVAVVRHRMPSVRGERYALSVDYRSDEGSAIAVRVLNAQSREAGAMTSAARGNVRLLFRAGSAESVFQISGRGASPQSVFRIARASLRGPVEPTAPWKSKPLAENAVSVTQLVSILVPISIVLSFVLPSAGDRRLFLVLTVSLAIGLAAYLGGILLLYLHTLSEYEGTRLASFGRYAGTFFLGWTIALLGILRCALRATGWRRRLTWAVVAFLAIGFLYTSPAAAGRWPLRGAPRLAVRAAVADLAGQIRSEVLPNEGAFIVWQNSNGLEFYILRYELAPRLTNVHGFTVGTPYSRADVWTWPLPPENFASMVREFDYLLVASADDQFWSEYGGLLAPEAAGETSVLFYSRGTPMGARLKIKRVFSRAR